MALFVLAGTSVVLAGISLFTETYVSGPDGDVGCACLPQAAPQRLPAFRWFWAMGTGVSPRQTRSTTGVWADGVVLGFRRRPAVVTAFVQAGARLTPSEMAWAQGHRPVVVDPVERRRIARNQTWLLRAFYVLLPLALGARILVAMDDTSPWGRILFGGAVVLFLVLSRLAPRLTGRR